MDEFTDARYNQIAENFVDIYLHENKLLAAKMVSEENVPQEHYPLLKEKIERVFLKQGYSFNEE